MRPLHELKAFAEVALQPGETRTVILTLTGQSLAFYDSSTSGWVTEPGEFTILVGSSSRTHVLRASFPGWMKPRFLA
jgi:beta-glucosidase